jgi:hypothetical protein
MKVYGRWLSHDISLFVTRRYGIHDKKRTFAAQSKKREQESGQLGTIRHA